VFYHLEEREIGGWNTVEVDGRVCPRVVEMSEREAGFSVWNDRRVDELLFGVLAAVEATAEQRHAHDSKHQPEHETDQ